MQANFKCFRMESGFDGVLSLLLSPRGAWQQQSGISWRLASKWLVIRLEPEDTEQWDWFGSLV